MSAMPSVIDRFIDYYARLDNQPPTALAALYHQDAQLIDPFGEHKGLFAIQRYFIHLLLNVDHCHFAIEAPVRDDSRFAVSWTMSWSHPRIAGGKTLSLPGCSMADIDNDLIVLQRDYYDAGAMIYEHVPLLGFAVRSVKRRVRS
ncbi:nuclear transport factor 2 family protein [Buttiauxella sp.]|uniref:nuclear transport factor 2 family protein n=1 Tax=Buttiauxella sp. TaxID=1972222 RepID=UPI003C78F8B4